MTAPLTTQSPADRPRTPNVRLVYSRLLTDLLAVYNITPQVRESLQCVELISEAFQSVVNQLGVRCPRCDDDELGCRSCGWEQNK